MDELDSEQKRLDKEIIKKLYTVVSNSFAEKIRYYMRESGDTCNYRIRDRNIVGRHCVGEFPFDDVWYTYTQDNNECYGQISIGLHNGKFFCYNYTKSN